MFFEGFDLRRVKVPDGEMRLRIGGSGPPLLLLHGNPQTHAMWHRVAPALSRRFTVVCPDLRGYGFSHKPPATPDHAHYSKRAMAADLVALMTELGFDRFRIGSHDRGARVAHRLALDHPQRVERLAMLDIVPTIEHLERTDMNFALGYWHWFFLAQRAPLPETMIGANPEEWFFLHTSREPKGRDFFAPDALADYLDALRDPATITGICEDYRAAVGIDLEQDRESRTRGEKIACPVLALWGAKGRVGQWYDPLDLWRRYAAAEVSGGPVASGHYLAEEAPEEVLAQFNRFFGPA